MSEDYGFRSGHGRLYQGEEGKIPKSGWQLVRLPSLPPAYVKPVCVRGEKGCGGKVAIPTLHHSQLR